LALNVIPLPYGLRDVKITPYVDAAATTLAGASIDLTNSQTFSWTESEDYETLRGDDSDVATHGKGAQIQWELASGGLSFEAYAAMAGGTVGTTGTTPNQVKRYTKLYTDSRPYFKVEGQAISDSGGDFHGVVYRAKATGDLTGSLEDGKFWITGAKGVGFKSNEASSLNRLYDFVQNETAVAIP
jgi:hypothetical protein